MAEEEMPPKKGGRKYKKERNQKTPDNETALAKGPGYKAPLWDTP